MSRNTLIFLFAFLILPALGLSQTKVEVRVVDGGNGMPLSSVSILDTKGQLLGNTNGKGNTTIFISDFPVFLEKKGFATRYAYSVKALQPAVMRKMGGEIPLVTIRGGIKNEDSLLVLRDQNAPFFCQKDTVLYYQFHYSLSLPDMDWEENATGYIAVHFRGIGAAPSSFNPYRYAYFLRFQYQNEDKDKILPPSKTMPVVLMFANDLMSGYGFSLWQKLTHSYLERNQRDWFFDQDTAGNKVFSGYARKDYNRLMEEIVFNRNDHLQKVSLFTPEEIQSVGSLRIFNDFSKNNGINSFRTVYTYSNTDSNRCLASIKHLSTFYDKGRTYYQMKFSANLVASVPEKECKIPVFYLAYNHEHPEQNGLGIWLLLQEGYNIKRDNWLGIQDRAQEKVQKEIEKMKRQQEEEERKAKQSQISGQDQKQD